MAQEEREDGQTNPDVENPDTTDEIDDGCGKPADGGGKEEEDPNP